MSLYKIQFQTKQKNTTNTIAHTEIKKKKKKNINELTTIPL